MKLSIFKILPRATRRPIDNKRIKYYLKNEKARQKPIFVVYAKDLDKYIIVDGHNRFLVHKILEKKKIECIIKATQPKTKFKDDFPLIDWNHYNT